MVLAEKVIRIFYRDVWREVTGDLINSLVVKMFDVFQVLLAFLLFPLFFNRYLYSFSSRHWVSEVKRADEAGGVQRFLGGTFWLQLHVAPVRSVHL